MCLVSESLRGKLLKAMKFTSKKNKQLKVFKYKRLMKMETIFISYTEEYVKCYILQIKCPIALVIHRYMTL